jgi:hypothetical protein
MNNGKEIFYSKDNIGFASSPHNILFISGPNTASIYYWALLLPLLLLPSALAAYLNWFSIQLFEQN